MPVGEPLNDTAIREEEPYRLMRVVKLCMWLPLAMTGNTLLKRSGKGIGQ